jgi:hypothetical protein
VVKKSLPAQIKKNELAPVETKAPIFVETNAQAWLCGIVNVISSARIRLI